MLCALVWEGYLLEAQVQNLQPNPGQNQQQNHGGKSKREPRGKVDDVVIVGKDPAKCRGLSASQTLQSLLYSKTGGVLRLPKEEKPTSLRLANWYFPSVYELEVSWSRKMHLNGCVFQIQPDLLINLSLQHQIWCCPSQSCNPSNTGCVTNWERHALAEFLVLLVYRVFAFLFAFLNCQDVVIA